ncbi:hypothetical protein HDU86_000345 [Geranomyces michiganensis]|nr:hypothetical protein HDU86_000345 [Geranomyces michiganensis]
MAPQKRRAQHTTALGPGRCNYVFNTLEWTRDFALHMKMFHGLPIVSRSKRSDPSSTDVSLKECISYCFPCRTWMIGATQAEAHARVHLALYLQGMKSSLRTCATDLIDLPASLRTATFTLPNVHVGNYLIQLEPTQVVSCPWRALCPDVHLSPAEMADHLIEYHCIALGAKSRRYGPLNKIDGDLNRLVAAATAANNKRQDERRRGDKRKRHHPEGSEADENDPPNDVV